MSFAAIANLPSANSIDCLFGSWKTVNVASRMESTGLKGRIQVSQETSALLFQAGRSLSPREEMIEAKGKGLLQTYWLDVPTPERRKTSIAGTTSTNDDTECSEVDQQGPRMPSQTALSSRLDEETSRLVEWNANNLVLLLCDLQARRGSIKLRSRPGALKYSKQQKGTMVLDEVCEIITLPKFDELPSQNEMPAYQKQLKPEVVDEVRLYVKSIAHGYHRNHFHNFEHVSSTVIGVNVAWGKHVLTARMPLDQIARLRMSL
jgi:Adenylate and Guanylate cyclase catalytic domain